MKRRRFSLGALAGSLLGAGLAALCLAPGWDGQTGGGRVVWSGVTFALLFAGGFAGLSAALRLHRSLSVKRPGKWPAYGALALILLFCLGAAGQALFMTGREPITDTAVDMVLLLDASGSMDSAGFAQARAQTAGRLVDSLSEDSRIQAVSFAATVLDATSFTQADESGKAELKRFIEAVDAVGMTDYNAPLACAADTLEALGRTDRNQAVVLVTDGGGDVDADSEAANWFKQQGAQVFIVRIGSGAASPGSRVLKKLAESTDGFDLILTPDADGSVNTEKLAAAFQGAFRSGGFRRVQRDGTLLWSPETSFYQFVIRALTLALSAVVFGLGYFGRFQPRMAVRNAACGLALAILISFLPRCDCSGGLLLACVFLAGAWVKFEWKEETLHV